MARICSLLLPLMVLLSAAPAAGQAPGEVAIEDLLQIIELDRNLVALDARGGGGPTERLEIGERLLRTEGRGKVGVAITDRRMLAIGVDSGFWKELRYRQGETPPSRLHLGDRLVLIITEKRILFFGTGSGGFQDQYLELDEKIVGLEVGSNVGVLVTTRRALGFSPFSRGFIEVSVQLQERIESIETRSNLATVVTSQRLLTFRSPGGAWGERDRNLR